MLVCPAEGGGVIHEMRGWDVPMRQHNTEEGMWPEDRVMRASPDMHLKFSEPQCAHRWGGVEYRALGCL